jgi:DNA-binding MurR/RpiR family transcriptional regulator
MVAAEPTLAQLVAGAGDELTPTERRLAAVMLEDPTVVAFGTVADVARRIDASGPTVVRFAAKLGFDGYGALQDRARAAMAAQLQRPTDRIRKTDEAAVFDRARATALRTVEAAFASVGPGLLEAMAALVAESPGRVWIVASATSPAPGQVLLVGLGALRPDVRQLAGGRGAVAAQIADAGVGDVVVAVDFKRYEHDVAHATRDLAAAGAKVVAITDSALSLIAGLADHWCEIDVPAIGPFDTSLGAVAVCEALVAEVADQLRDTLPERFDRLEALWAANDMFLGADG